MKLPFINIMNIKNERGQSAITLAMLAITFLILAGFTIDIANLLLQKSHLQRALDAGAIAGITRYSSGDASGTIVDTAKEVALYNLGQMIQNPDANVTGTFGAGQDGMATLQLSGTINTGTLFMRLIPGVSLSTVVTAATSTASRNPAIISLVLDASGSMGGSMSALKTAAKAFVDSF